MSIFQFALKQRVTVATKLDGIVEGVVSGAKMMINKPHEYDVHYLMPDLALAHIVVAEDVLASQQPKKNVVKVDFELDQQPLDDALEKARELKRLTTAKRKKPAKSKRRR